MSLKDVDLKMEYYSLVDDVTNEFYIPLLKNAVSYKRAVGYFSSSSLIELSTGISGLIKNGGEIKLIASPNLSEDDINAIRKGYKDKQEVIEEAIIRELKEPIDTVESDRLNYLANLIADGILDIKLAITQKNSQIGLFHVKIGVIEDQFGNKVAFSGSMNESKNGFLVNCDQFDVFKNWTSDKQRADSKEEAFDRMWMDNEIGIKVFDGDRVSDQIIKKYKKADVDYTKIELPNDGYVDEKLKKEFFKVPKDTKFYDEQKKAIKNWLKNSCCGIYDMATGTGKTITALGSVAALSEGLGENLAVIITAPYIHLVDQWVEDIENFNVTPIVAYGEEKDWRKKFKNAVRSYNNGRINNFCIITTNATFSSKDFQKYIKMFRKDYCFVADEAHNLGAKKLRELLPLTARYRLALSATLERYGDEEGTNALLEYFGERCIVLNIKDAIQSELLTRYYYYPILVYLDDEELEEYKHYTELIRKNSFNIKSGDEESNSYLEYLLIKRARVISGCKSKLNKIVEIMEAMKEENNILVYCGTTKYDRDDISDDGEIKQIDEVNRLLNEELGIKVRKFTASESPKDRKNIRDQFINHTIQVITAIKCLDEGVNIPAIHKAVIMASTTNPKEFVQRRGRVLRKSDGKKYAYIYDFVTLARPLDEVKYISNEEKQTDKKLFEKEADRVKQFADTAENEAESYDLIERINSYYK